MIFTVPKKEKEQQTLNKMSKKIIKKEKKINRLAHITKRILLEKEALKQDKESMLEEIPKNESQIEEEEKGITTDEFSNRVSEI